MNEDSKSIIILNNLMESISPGKDFSKYKLVSYYSKDLNFEMISAFGSNSYIAAIKEITGEGRKVYFEFALKNPDDGLRIKRVIDSSISIFADGAKRAQSFINLNSQIGELLKNKPTYTSEELEVFLIESFLDDVNTFKNIQNQNELITPEDLTTIIESFFIQRKEVYQDIDYSKQMLKNLLIKIGTQFSRITFNKFFNLFKNDAQNVNFDSNFNYSQLLDDEWLAVFFGSRDRGFQTIESIV
jgi:hypothetical protein